MKQDHEMTWKDINLGCVITEPGNASSYQTGDWRSQRPTYDTSKCIKCGLCAMYCPEPCINTTEEGFYHGSWRSERRGLVLFGPRAMTRAMCPPGSLHDQFVKHWFYVRSYRLRDGRLYLALMADGGIYELEPLAR